MSDNWTDLPVYEAGQYSAYDNGSGGGINLNKVDDNPPPFEAAVPSYDAQAPPFESEPVGINLDKNDRGGGINLHKREEAAPPYEPPEAAHAPRYVDNDVNAKPFESYVEEPQKQRVAANNTTNVEVRSVSTNNAIIFHVVSLICCLLSLVFSPLIEIIPACLICCLAPDLKRASSSLGFLHWIDFFCTCLVAFLYLCLIIVIAVFTFGIGLVLLVFLIPYFFVISGLAATNPNGPTE